MGQIDIEYKKLVEHVLDNGSRRPDRTGTGVISSFGYQYRVDLREGFPLLTTKKINFNNVYHELMWICRSETNIRTLKSPKIWEPWADEDGELHGIYGRIWRNWGESSCGCDPGVDQLTTLINGLKESPYSRRHVVSAWNPYHNISHPHIPNACHTMFQCYVSDGEELGEPIKYLDLQLYQRSCDLAIGFCYNCASYAILLTMLARECNMIPRFLIHTLGDFHIYLNQEEKIKEQILREPRESPTLALNHEFDFFKLAERDDPDSDVALIDYRPHPFISYPVAV